MISWPHRQSRLVDAASGVSLGGSALERRVGRAARAFDRLPHGVVFAALPHDIDSVVRYLACLRANRAVLPLDLDAGSGRIANLVDRYAPAAVVGIPSVPPEGWRAATDDLLGHYWAPRRNRPTAAHTDLGLLLTTSGSTGNSKLVRLSTAALENNTAAIIGALGISPADVTISSLPFHYSFGLSVLHTHLAAGATVVLESGGLTHRPFWDAVATHRITSLAAVPYQYEVLRRLRFDPARYPDLRTLTQAGGRLRRERVLEFHERMTAVGGRLFVMYGQTEAGPRITTLPSERLPGKLGSVGPALRGGRLSIRHEDGTETTQADVTGEVIYRGPNVMMGYAETAADLSRSDDLGGVLATGDLGRLDVDSYLYLEGRRARFGKVFGVRVSLDDVEAIAGEGEPVAAVSGEDRITVWVEGADEASVHGRAVAIAEHLRVHWTGIEVRSIDALPLLANGKVDLRELERRSG